MRKKCPYCNNGVSYYSHDGWRYPCTICDGSGYIDEKDEQTSPYHKNPLDDEWEDDDDDDYPFTKDGEDYLN